MLNNEISLHHSQVCRNIPILDPMYFGKRLFFFGGGEQNVVTCECYAVIHVGITVPKEA